MSRDLAGLAAEVLEDDDNKSLVVSVLAEFFQDSFKDDPVGVSDWLAQGGTSVDLFIDMVALLRRPQASEAPHG